jgi:thioredoxin reductase (NADPH)
MTERNLEYTESLIEKGHIKSLLGTDIAYLEDLNGQIKVIFKEQEPILIDHIIYAIGGSDPKEFLSSIGINMRGESEFVDDHYESKREGVFIIGDLSAGKKGGSINYSFGQAKKAIREVCKNHLDCKI